MDIREAGKMKEDGWMDGWTDRWMDRLLHAKLRMFSWWEDCRALGLRYFFLEFGNYLPLVDKSV